MPVLHLLAGPNGSGKSTFIERVLQSATHLPFVNADVIAAERWPDAQAEHAYEASQAAAEQRTQLLEAGQSFITETVFSHPSKLQLVEHASSLGYIVYLHVIMIPVEVAVVRVGERVQLGGHAVPENKIRERYDRLWSLVTAARTVADSTVFRDNSTAAHSFRIVAEYQRDVVIGEPKWPVWTPAALRG